MDMYAERDNGATLEHECAQLDVRDSREGEDTGGGERGEVGVRRGGEQGAAAGGAAELCGGEESRGGGVRVGGLQDQRQRDEQPAGRAALGTEGHAGGGSDERVRDIEAGCQELEVQQRRSEALQPRRYFQVNWRRRLYA